MTETDFLSLKEQLENKEKGEQLKNIINNDILETAEPLPSRNNTDDLIKEIHKQAVVKVIKEDNEVKKNLLEKAKSTVINGFEALEQEKIAKKQEQTYNANEEACKSYGIDKAVPLWQVKMMRIGHAFWFIIYFIVASVSIAPINVFFKGIKSFIKSTWLSLLFAVLSYLIITVLMPFLITYFTSLKPTN